jgi:hypothetical protein
MVLTGDIDEDQLNSQVTGLCRNGLRINPQAERTGQLKQAKP